MIKLPVGKRHLNTENVAITGTSAWPDWILPTGRCIWDSKRIFHEDSVRSFFTKDILIIQWNMLSGRYG